MKHSNIKMACLSLVTSFKKWVPVFAVLKMQRWCACIIMIFAEIGILDSRLIFMAWFGCSQGVYCVTMYKMRFFSVP